ncbi:MAG: hypothetical protein NBV68_11695 [Erythrobacter sp.]|uniref:hypothetical protein n=1 Tax=Erythrobacter sp. TaxID=1042 RepID=UPI0025F449C3|nr:hypothetical protein [Erythrobacter sp.]MCM0000037.1 hypothetical protein [Erythrobacter sp.]
MSFAERPSDAPRGAANEIVPSTRLAPPRVPDQIEMATGAYRPQKALIRPGRFSDQLKSLGPTRGITLAQLQSNPRFTIGKTQVDMTRVLANPQSVANRATALSKLTDTVRINSTTFEATEVKSGLIVRSFVNYSLRPGACTVQARRVKLEAAGVRCATPMTKAERDKAYATPGNPRYIADPALRSEALKAAEDDARQLAQDVTALRGDLKIPQLRAEMVAAIGEAEVKRIEGLSDADLAAEIANSGDTKMEDVAYIPVNDAAQSYAPAVKLGLAPPPMPPEVKKEYDLGTNYFLAGFTFGREYEWRLRVEQRINRCLIGCAKTYYVEAFAGFNYGLGLRFPIELTGSALYTKASSGAVMASVTPKIRTLDGNAEHYLAAGLPPEKLFNAQEFVAQFGAHAGFGFDVPFYPSLSVAFAREIDFTDYLGGQFKGGNFLPPTKGAPLTQDIKISDIDLIGGRANFGFVGAQVFPAARVTLASDELSLMLVDKNGGAPVKLLQGQPAAPILMKTNTATDAMEFDIKDPLYKLTMTIEPGINARVFVDVGLWGKSWDMPVYFPSLAVTVPSGGVTFGCHDGTVCTRSFNLAPDIKEAARNDLARWVNGFETRWFKACPDSTCEKEIRTTRIATAAVVNAKINKGEAPATLRTDPAIAKLFDGVERDAAKSWGRAMLRRFSVEFEPTWAGKCPDTACRNALKAIRTQTEAALTQQINAGVPAPDTGKIYLGISYAVPPAIRTAQTDARSAVTASINARIQSAAPKWASAVMGEYFPKCWDDQCRYEVALGADAMVGDWSRLSKLSPDTKPVIIENEVIARFRPRLAKAVSEGKARELNSIIK